MRFGICTKPENLSVLERLGYDYIELEVVSTMGLSREEISSFQRQLAASRVKCEAFNVLFPETMTLLDGSIGDEELKEYLRKAMALVNEFGAKTLVFGSGKCRRCPDDMAFGQAYRKLISIYRMAGEAAGKYGIQVVIEPLSRSETNMICTMMEGAMLEADVDHPNVGLLSDFYHVIANHDRIEDIEAIKKLGHVHIAAARGRRYPTSMEGEEYEAFFRSLKAIGYDGRVSIEGKTENIEEDGALALELLKKLEAQTLMK